MIRKMIIKSPTLYSLNSFLLNLILLILVIVIFVLPSKNTSQLGILQWIAFGIFSYCFFCSIFLTYKHFGATASYLFTNTAVAIAEAFIHFHNNQKTKELEIGFKIIRKLQIFTCWYWIYALIYRKNHNVQRVVSALQKFASLNKNIYRAKWPDLLPYEGADNYILVEI